MNHNDFWLTVGLLVVGWLLVVLYGRITQSIEFGRPVMAAGYSLLASPFMFVFLAVYGENRRLVDVVNIHVLSLTLMLGDTFALPIAFMAAAYARRSQRKASSGDGAASKNDWARTRVWRWASLLIGLGLGLVLHLWDVNHHYSSGNAVALASSMTKDYRELVALPILFGAAIYILPSVFRLHNKYTAWYLGGIMAWLVFAAIDSTIHGFDPQSLHVACGVACGAHNLSVHAHYGVDVLRNFLHYIHVI